MLTRGWEEKLREDKLGALPPTSEVGARAHPQAVQRQGPALPSSAQPGLAHRPGAELGFSAAESTGGQLPLESPSEQKTHQ